MLQVLYIGVAKINQDVAHFVMAVHVCFKCMFQMFHLFQTYVAIVLFGCCKSRSGYCIYMHVTSICFQVFSGVSYICLQVFHLDVTNICNGFQMFSDVFISVEMFVSSVSSVFFIL
jgi:hypothetical protein